MIISEDNPVHVIDAFINKINLLEMGFERDIKEAFDHLEITKLPTMVSEVQHLIDTINQKEM